MKTILGFAGVTIVLLVKLALAVIGLVVVPFTHPVKNRVWGNKIEPVSPSWHMEDWPDWWADYVWRAIRNPVNNLRFLFEEPEVKVFRGVGNPDIEVRIDGFDKATRLIPGWLPEYWHMRRLKSGTLFEFRVGWKYSGVPGFTPTIQLRWER